MALIGRERWHDLGSGQAMKILHVSCSPRGQASESYRLSRKLISLLLMNEPSATVVERVIGGGALPHIDGNYAAALAHCLT
jgi:FMN-dependent NADH-azoreductase